MSGYVITERVLHLLKSFFTINARRVKFDVSSKYDQARNRFHVHIYTHIHTYTHVFSTVKLSDVSTQW